MEKTQVGAAVDKQLWQKVRIKAIEDNCTAGEIVEAALRAYMGGQQPQVKPPKKQTTGSAPAAVEAFILDHEDRTAREVAELLNNSGYTTAKGGTFNMNIIGKIRNRMKQEGKR